MQVAAWSAALDEIEETLRVTDALAAASAEAALLDGTAELAVAAWSAPEGLGALPPELAPRAEALLASIRSVAARAASTHADLRVELADPARAPRRRPTAGSDEPPAARFVDHSA